MKYRHKKITPESIAAALDKIERYRLLNQPDQAESIARDILEVSPDHKGALRELGLALTDQFDRHPGKFAEALEVFGRIRDPYETPYLLGLAHERLCRARLATGAPAGTLSGLIQQAMRFYAEAEARRPPGNDDAILRWNSIVRLLEHHPELRPGDEPDGSFDFGDSPPV